MSEELERLARRAMACRAFGWRPGMRVWCGEHLSPLRFVGPRVGHQPVARVDGPSPPGMVTRYVYVPDLADAATLGCLVKTAVGLLDAIDAAGGSTSTRRASLAAAVADYITGTSDGVTLAAAIVAALEAASEVAP